MISKKLLKKNLIPRKKLKKSVLELRKRVLSKHPSHKYFRTNLPVIQGLKYVVRLGSITEVEDIVKKGGSRIEINSIDSIKNSGNKFRMKRCFDTAGVRTAEWWSSNNFVKNTLPYPIVAKHLYGSRGTGNYLINSLFDFEKWAKGKEMSSYIFERFYSFSREYRLHISRNGCFYTCRKMLKEGTPENEKWHRHDDNSVWILETNSSFDKPVNWNNIVNDCVKALNAIGADVLSFDVKVQSANDNKGNKRKECNYILIECNSASSHGDVTAVKYIEEITKLIKQKSTE